MADEELDQQLAELPEGWKVARLGDMISFVAASLTKANSCLIREIHSSRWGVFPRLRGSRSLV